MDIISYYEKYGSRDYIGESITQNEHMIQAAMLAEKDNQPIEVVLAAFLHDIGHLIQYECSDENRMGKYGIKNHEKIGSQFLRDIGIRYPIPELVENHVKVKRYRTFKDKEYYKKLSDASKKTLDYQGGPMNKEEAENFEKDPLFKYSLKIRDYDDMAKIPNIKIHKLNYFRQLLSKL